jgi:hypothetical protein
MNASLSPQQLRELPVHDADFVTMHVAVTSEGVANVDLILEINSEESFIPFTRLGITDRKLLLRFENCWHVGTKLRCHQSSREQVLDWEIVSESDPIRELRCAGLANGITLYHLRLEMSGGSVLDLVAERLGIVNAGNIANADSLIH